MVHHTKLQPGPFEKIKSGQKAFELRPLGQKRQAIAVGDIIEILNLANNQEKIRVRVIALHPFANFAELYNTLPLQCGYTKENVSCASPDDMEQYYSKEKQAKWGVIGIELEHIRDWQDNNITI